MQIFLEVIDDLYQFALSAIGYLFKKEKKEPLFLPHHEYMSLPESAGSELSEEEIIPNQEPTTFRTLDDILLEKKVSPTVEGKNTVMYVGSAEADLFMNPTKEFDGVIDVVPYGEMLMVLGLTGRFAHVSLNGTLGYIAREDLVDRAAYVYPEFVIGEANDIDDPNTIRLRAMIRDTFGAGKIEFPLQAGEYVLYRLLRKGIKVNWPKTRPRIPGRWHVLFRGVPGVHIGIVPRAGSVMEYVLDNDIGHVAYVEAVFPDETITISETNYPDSGIYSERTLTRDEWREYKPIFIQIS